MSAFGRWIEVDGLPAFEETVHPNDPVCTWDPIVAAPTNRHWCAVGNRRLQLVCDNFGTVAVRDTADGFRWVTPREGAGATVIDGAWGTDLARWPDGVTPIRLWGPTWFGVELEHDGLHVERTVSCPDGEDARVIVRVLITSDRDRTITIAEDWGVVGRIENTAVLEAGDVVTFAYELLCDGDPVLQRATNTEGVVAASLASLWARLPRVECERVPVLAREIPWHMALLTGGACVDNVLGGHTLDQASAYSFDLGFNGAARDPLQHALPLIYTEPDLALSVLRNTCAWAGPDGKLPYALGGTKAPIADWFDPSDQALWSLWLAAEYLAATDDVAAFGALAPFHPVYEAEPVPLVEHLVLQFRDLVDRVGVGAHGHIRILNADWNDSALTLAPIDRDLMEAEGESVLNSAMAAWVLPRFAGLLRRIGGHDTTAAEADALATKWRDLVAGEWNGRWFRRAYGPGAVVGDDELWLEAQPWAILCGAADPDRARELLRMIDEVVRTNSPLGARVRGPVPIVVPEGRIAGEGSAGGVWFSINMTLAWAAASVGEADYAWDELRRMTLDAHTAAYPHVWEGTISGPDAYNTPESPRPGATWAWPLRGIGMQSFPVNNLHCHAQVVLTYLRLLGVEPTSEATLRIGDDPAGSFQGANLIIQVDR